MSLRGCKYARGQELVNSSLSTIFMTTLFYEKRVKRVNESYLKWYWYLLLTISSFLMLKRPLIKTHTANKQIGYLEEKCVFGTISKVKIADTMVNKIKISTFNIKAVNGQRSPILYSDSKGSKMDCSSKYPVYRQRDIVLHT